MKNLIIPILLPVFLVFFTADINAQSCCASKSAKKTELGSKKAETSSMASIDKQKASSKTVAEKGEGNPLSTLISMTCCAGAGSKTASVCVKGEKNGNPSCEELCKKMGCDPAKCTKEACEELCKKMGCDPKDCDPGNCKMTKCEKRKQL